MKYPSIPIILNMGSYTWPPFAGKVDMMIDIFNKYCNKNNKSSLNIARFLTIYIDEAHAHDEWWLPDSPNAVIMIIIIIFNNKSININNNNNNHQK